MSASARLLLFAGVVCAAGAFAAPQLKVQPEVVGGVRLRVLQGAEGVPAPTPKATFWRVVSNGVESVVKKYDERELAYVRELLGTWKDKKGNVMHLAKPAAYPWGENVKYKTTVEFGDETYYIDFDFAVPVKDAEAQKLLKDAAKSLAAAGSSAKAGGAMKWWEESNDDYLFLTDLTKSQGGAFIKTTMKLMSAMRRSYEFYVPPLKKVGRSKVRVFKTLAAYRDYRASTGEKNDQSIGLWDPSREELLVSAEGDRNAAQETMRHEAFHQYLHYATGRGDHAMWFNEGHATFFESIQYNPAKNAVKILDTGRRAEEVAKNPERVAKAIARTLKMSRADYYGGSLETVNFHYTTGWAITYFLEKGVYADEDFAPYRKILPKYLEEMTAGASADEATAKAWALVEGRDVAADFLKFWTKYRNAAKNAR